MKIPVLKILSIAAAAFGTLQPLQADNSRVELRGRWVLDSGGKAVGPDSFRRGLQTSALLWRGSVLLSVGDQRSQYPSHLFHINPANGRLLGPPMKITPPGEKPGENRHFKTYRSIPNSDFEGLAADPAVKNRLYGITEDKVPWISVLRLEKSGGATTVKLESLTQVRFPEGLKPWDGNKNFRLEGIALGEDSARAYLAYERALDDLPRILEIKLADLAGKDSVTARDLEISFDSVTRRPDKKKSLLNINDIQFLRRDKRSWLIALARDQERILLIDLEKARVVRWVDLDLREPGGGKIYWVSPEGIAIDQQGGRLWIINDPDSVSGNYRRRGVKKADGMYALYAPLLFELKLAELFPSAAGRKP
ncbi:MAG: SdiA-regulated domain-containing protein [Planctomycetota bacterium]|nr:SdiA-regulated domain-containing protein [Planctomycetota bacterium]